MAGTKRPDALHLLFYSATSITPLLSSYNSRNTPCRRFDASVVAPAPAQGQHRSAISTEARASTPLANMPTRLGPPQEILATQIVNGAATAGGDAWNAVTVAVARCWQLC